LSTATWYICPIGSTICVKVRPWSVVIPIPPSPVAIQ
jgi:hypothetical protein